MRFRLLFAAATTALVIAGGTSTASAAVALPTANCGTVAGTNCLVFDNFTVYSLDLLNFQSVGHKVQGNDPFQVQTNGTYRDNALVIGTGPSGAVINSDILPGGVVDDAFSTPNSAGGVTNFQSSAGTANTQGNNIPGGSALNTWDIKVSSLVNYLNGGQLAFFFNLNQTNTTSYLDNSEDALGWMAVTLSDSTGQHQSLTFYLDGNACSGTLGAPNSPNCDRTQTWGGAASDPNRNPNPNNVTNANSNLLTDQPSGGAGVGHDEWAYIHGQICMAPSGAVVGFGACDKNDKVNKTVDQNLGEVNAAFALYSDALQQWLLSGDYDKMSVDFRMAALDNGFEQLIIAAVNIPEPITVMTFGAGLLGLTAFAARRRRKLKAA